ncbi:MAG: NADH-quinone oxidoreductase subunit NuoH [Anaerolineales bacterium]|jgi:NADH-quinone oxidoreductase subunit H|nr:NADH-quinone oxidoreductase subunit NuoH [Anaerolineales bacterium]
MDFGSLLEWTIKSVVLLLALTGGFAYVTLYERKVLSRLQVRIGPNRAGPYGLLQPVADGIKLIFKEELIPANAQKLIFVLAPVITVLPALTITAVIPWGGTIELFGRQVSLSLADVNVGMLYITAIASIAVYGITLAGWSSDNKYAMLGGLRASAQMISYELALGLAFVTPVMLAGSMRVSDIIKVQVENGFLGWIGYLAAQPLAPIIFMIASLAEVNRSPFDMPEAEQELTAGYHTEYSGMKFALFFMAEYIKMIAVSMIGATLFFGGYYGPFVEQFPLLGPVYLFLKVTALLFGMIWIRATLPRIRYDRLMVFGWKGLLPAGLLNVLFTAVAILVLGGM